jgi:3D (Asp-Asp-Asp) domain-containing protein
MSMRRSAVAAAVLLAAACGPSSGQRWVNELPDGERTARDDGWKDAPPPAPSAGAPAGGAPEPGTPPAEGDVLTPAGQGGEVYRNTYYDFPRDRGGDRSATLYDASCQPIVAVSKRFHDEVCVQGSGKLVSGDTVSFAKRDCACAAVCPRTSQKICFERLDPARFPHGRGATGRAITPLRTVAVDTTLIPLGTPLFIPELVGMPLPEGGKHDGCFLAEDRGLKVVGRHIDLFTGDPEQTKQWNALVPSNRGVRVYVGEARCAKR